MVFLILFPSFMPKNDAFLISFKSFFLLFSYSFYLFYSFLMHYGCIFSQTLVELYDYSFFLCRLLSNFLLFTAFLCIMHLISLCFSLIITIFSYYYLYRCTRQGRRIKNYCSVKVVTNIFHPIRLLVFSDSYFLLLFYPSLVW